MWPELTVPPIYSPIPPAIHPSHAAIDAQTTAWAEAVGIGSSELRNRLVQHDIGTFAARVLPEGRAAVVGILADFVLWLFGVDDGYCEEGELGRQPGQLMAALLRLLRVAQNPEVPMLLDDPLARGLRDLQRRISEHGTVGQAALWVHALREYFSTVVWEAEHRRAGTVPDLNDYTLMRLYDGATTVVLPLLEMGHGYELQPAERDQKSVRAAVEMASFIITWDNDLFSHHKESRGTGYYLNAVRVLEHEYQLSPGQAIDMAISQRDRVMRLFLRLRERMLPAASPQLGQYLTSLATFIRGAQDWGISSVRYTTPDDPAGLPTAFRETPTDRSDKPVDIPVISWWWDLDLVRPDPPLAQDTQAGSPPSTPEGAKARRRRKDSSRVLSCPSGT
ncbi:selina-4(15),7(11)-diene synthase [Streptomyces sp. NPDC005408]|uniref:selina-4(15),7(11)-diene synthase n=1 Tax=Streptomyces sp. NPDC005408 TaxID=3155341 RepID=UPI0033AC400E